MYFCKVHLYFSYILVVSLLIALVIYPVCFAAELNFGKFGHL